MNDLLNSFTQQENSQLDTKAIKIKDNALILDHEAIQLHNISMIRRNEFKSPVTLKDFIILGILLIISLFPPFIGFLFFGLYAYYVYTKHQQHLQSKYFITLNLGSSHNYRLYFQDYKFRDQVYETLIKAFNTKNQSIYIDMSKQEIGNLNIAEKGATQHNITGDNNTVDSNNVSGNGNLVSFGGDVNQNSSISKNSTSVEQSIDLPWKEIELELDKLTKQQNLSTEIKNTLEELKIACQNKDMTTFTETVQKNKKIFDKEFIQNTISGTLSAIVATILTLPLIKY